VLTPNTSKRLLRRRAATMFILVPTVRSEVPMSSKRAEILKLLLPHIASNNYDQYDGYIIFGASSVFEMIDAIAARPSEREDDSLVRAAHELIGHLRLHEGRSRVARRASLDSPPPLKTDVLSGTPSTPPLRTNCWASCPKWLTVLCASAK
jgi:hypothetical protein